MEDFSPALFEQRSIDRLQLQQNISSYFPHRAEISLEEVVADHPPQQGIGELLTYLEIAHQDDVTEDRGTFFAVWLDEAGILRRATLPNLIFRKEVT